MGAFSNEFDVKLLIGLGVFALMAAPMFGYFYNKLMDRLDNEHEHTSLYVAGGNLFTLLIGALISWKAALLFFVLFALDGMPMVVGEFKRTHRKMKSPRRKRMPYAANGLLDEAKMASEQARKLIGKTDVTKDDLRLIEHELSTITLKIMEVKQIQITEK
jgi:hypothetical protein